MVEPRWEVRIGSPVVTTGGEYGRLHQLIMDRRKGGIIALLVRRHGLLPTRTVVIPWDMVTDATESEVCINLALDQVDALPEYPSESAKANLDPSAWIIEGGKTLFDRDDQPVGKVSLILVNPEGQVTGIVMQVGYLPRRNLIVPAGWIQDMDEEKVPLTVEKNALEGLPEYCSDEILEVDVDNALWSDEILRNTDYDVIGVDVQDGVVILRGHVYNSLNKDRAEKATRSITGVLHVENGLVVDQELTTEVAQAIATLQLTPLEHVSVGAHHGFITLTGQVSHPLRRESAEIAAASIPRVRGIANFIHAPGVILPSEGRRFWQPLIGEEVYATDMQLGHVEHVVINPNNRCVTAFVTHGHFPDPHRRRKGQLPDEMLQERSVVIPTRSILYDGGGSLGIMDSGVEAARYPDVSPSDVVPLSSGWQPPYPYYPEDVLLERGCSFETKELVLSQSHP